MPAVRKKPKRKIFFPHQSSAFSYTLNTRHPALFMEMRLGKTLVTVRRCKTYKALHGGTMNLVVAPTSALPSWEKEARGEGCDVQNLYYMDTKKINEILTGLFEFHGEWSHPHIFFLLNKEAWNRKDLVDLDQFTWTSIILDESTFIKNPQAKVTQYFTKRFRQVPHRWILTGTPWPECESEVYTQLDFLGYKLLGKRSYWAFRNAHMTQFPFGGWGIRSNSRKKIHSEVGKVALIMRRKDVDMSEVKVREKRVLILPESIRRIYDKAEKEFILETPGLDDLETVWAVSRYSWLRQICGGFARHVPIWEGKLKELEDLKKGELKNDRIVVWCEYKDEVFAINRHFGGNRGGVWTLTGENSPQERWLGICAWGKSHSGVLALTRHIAEEGMDLSAADTEIYYSTPVALKARKQTEDRIVSMRKINAGVPLLVMDFVVKDSVDEDIQKVIARKDLRSDRGMTQALIQCMKERKGL